MDDDAIVVGSGFGGAVTACRLAEPATACSCSSADAGGASRTFRASPTTRGSSTRSNRSQRNGWFDFRVFPHMMVVAGAGVGGGSLVYANISVNAKDDSFANGWPPEITPAELAPYYERVGAMLDVQKVPADQWPERTRLLKEGAERNGWSSRFQRLDLAVTFDPEWNYELPDPHGLQHSKTFINAQGIEQGTCVHLGNCDIGCEARARNTLDYNYLPVARAPGRGYAAASSGAHDRRRAGRRYRVTIRPDHECRPGWRQSDEPLVIVAAGSIGSTELLLRSRDVARTLPRLVRFSDAAGAATATS